ncbi:MAG TPA: malate synthase A, partial [Aestuariivirga sp.]|nr:malate synthase A [Aestuariivirga sp.]
PTSNQLYVAREDVKAGQKEMLEIPKGAKTEAAFRDNLRTLLRHTEASLRGITGDLEAAEIARAQVWQWFRLGVKLDGRHKVTRKFLNSCLAQEMQLMKEQIGAEVCAKGRFKDAIARVKALATSTTLDPFCAPEVEIFDR